MGEREPMSAERLAELRALYCSERPPIWDRETLGIQALFAEIDRLRADLAAVRERFDRASAVRNAEIERLRAEVTALRRAMAAASSEGEALFARLSEENHARELLEAEAASLRRDLTAEREARGVFRLSGKEGEQ